MNTIEAFLFVLAVGGFISAVTLFFTRRLTERWWWRAVICILFGMSIAPGCFQFSIFGPPRWVVWPAAFVLLNLFDGTDVLFSLMVGGLPVLLCASLMFVFWSVVIRRRHRLENHVA